MTNALTAVKTLGSFARRYLQRLTFQRINFCITELLIIPRIAQIIDPHAPEDVHLVLKLQGPEFPPRVVYAFTSSKEYRNVLIHPHMLSNASFQTSGASSRFHGKAAMTRFFVQRSHSLTRYKELFSYNRQTRRYVTAMAIVADTPSHALLEMALLRCHRRTTSSKALPPAKALRARQLRMMFGLSQVSEASSKELHQSTMIKAPHQSEHVYDMLDASLLEFCNQTGIAPTHWSRVSTPDVHFELDASPPMVNISREEFTQDSKSNEELNSVNTSAFTKSPRDLGITSANTNLNNPNLELSRFSAAFITEDVPSVIHIVSNNQNYLQSPTKSIQQASSIVHLVDIGAFGVDEEIKYDSGVLLNHTPIRPPLEPNPHTPDEIIDAFFNTESKREVQTILDEIGLLSADDISI